MSQGRPDAGTLVPLEPPSPDQPTGGNVAEPSPSPAARAEEPSSAQPVLVELTVDEHRYRIALPNIATDYIQKKIGTELQPYERVMLEDMRRRLSPGDTVLDIGANVGNHALYLAAVVGCRVVAFEPNRGLCAALRVSIEANGLQDRLTVHPMALGRTAGSGGFAELLPENLGGQRIVQGAGDLAIAALDALALEPGTKALKVDVEGMELDVLQGGAAVLRRDRPMLYVECQHEADFRSIAGWLEGEGYCYWDTFNVTPTHLFLPNERVGLEQRIARLQYKAVQDDYRSVRQLEEANLKYRRATEDISRLKQHLANEQAARRGEAQQAERLQHEQRAAMEGQARELASAKLRLEASAAERERVAAEMEELRQRLMDMETLNASLQGEILQLESERDTFAAVHLDESRRLAALQRQSEHLRTGLEAYQAWGNRSSAWIQQSREQYDKLQRELQQARTRLAGVERRLSDATAQVARTRASASYRLGNALLQSTRSWRAAADLPRSLWKVARDRRLPPEPNAAAAAPPARPVPAALPKPPAPPQLDARKPLEAEPSAVLQTLKVAAIMDEFTHGCFREECNLLQLTPQHWRRELELFRPELLFIESAWRGKRELWGSQVGHRSEAVRGVIEWCRKHGVTTVFWNKEDPVHFESFLSTAKLFDHVFTTDIDCIHRYKAALGHERVHLLPFACQPRVHNPIETHERKDAFCFAGAYYVRYPERTRDLGNFAATLPEWRPLEIYDRNHGKSDPNYSFPAEYQPYIVGSLPFEEIDKAYKGYRYAINLNSIKQSQSMFARRVYELLGSNTLTVSNYSRAVRLMFGGLVISTDSGPEALREIKARAGDPVAGAKLRLAALRKVMAEHTYQDRLAYVMSKVRGEAPPELLPRMTVLGTAYTAAEAAAVVRSFKRQSYRHKRLVLMLAPEVPDSDLPPGVDMQVIRPGEAGRMALRELGAPGDWLAVMLPHDHHGANYLLDLALATRYAPGPVVGKAAHYAWSAEGGLELLQATEQYRPVGGVPARAGAIRLDALPAEKLLAWASDLERAQLEHEGALAIDPFNYCRGADAPGFSATQMLAVDDLPGLDCGLALAELVRRAERIPPADRSEQGLARIGAAQLAAWLKQPPNGSKIKLSLQGAALRIDSRLPDGRHEYWYAVEDQAPATFGAREGRLMLHLDQVPGLDLQFVLLFLDGSGERIAHVVKAGGRNHEIELPAGTEKIRFGLRIHGRGSAQLRSLLLGHRSTEPAEILGRSEHLLLTNHYPSNDDLYRNGFVHRRVAAYAQRGERVDVFRLRPGEPLRFHEFEDIDCITGSKEALHQMLASGGYRSVLVHFLDEAMWDVLQQHVGRIKVVVWVHGAEIQPMHRREYNYKTDAERAVARRQSDLRMAFWRRVLDPMPAGLHLVFVSRYFAEEVMEDLGLRLPESAYSIIHNPIDTSLFAYRPKPAEQRRKLLSIRPYASAKYANDLTVAAIRRLSTEPFFQDLEFRLIGDGALFDETLAPLRDLPNVTIERRFLTQPQIAELHRDYGIFLTPTRMDAQGVSRDEAMSSGLVPVTNAVAAIPEFVDEHCGVLAPAEDAEGMAQGIARLVGDSALFVAMSRAAAERVRRQSASEHVVAAELALFRG